MHIASDQEQKKVASTGFIYCGVCGNPKTGKTTLATACAAWPEFGRIAYIAADPKADSLLPVLPEYRDKLSVVTLGRRPATEKELAEESKLPAGTIYYDPRYDKKFIRTSMSEDAMRAATYDWAAAGFKTLIWDTVTATMDAVTDEIAQQEAGRDRGTERFAFKAERATDIPFDMRKLYSPNMSDIYLAQSFAQNRIMRPLKDLACHTILIFHVDLDTDRKLAGPATAGKKQLSRLPGQFDFFIVTDTTPNPQGGVQYQARVAPFSFNDQYKMPAGVRQNLTNKVFKQPIVPLKENPAHFWQEVLKLVSANPATVNPATEGGDG